MNLADIFNSDAFNTLNLTAKVNKLPFVPGQAGRLGIFEELGVPVRTIVVEEQSGTLSLIPNTTIGAPPNQNNLDRRKVRSFVVPHHPLEAKVMASEIQGVRAFGSTELQAVEDKVQEHLKLMNMKHDATLEYGRIGAIKGNILDADGSTVIYNLFTEFGVSQDSVDFVLGTSTTDIKGKCNTVSRYIETELGQALYDHVHCFCGKDWFDKFVKHAEVKAAYERWADRGGQQGDFLRADNRKGFPFAGIWFEEYRGAVGGVSFVADAEAHFFPVGVPGLFITRYAPADTLEAANTPGLPRYAMREIMEYGRGMKVLTESNPINLCTRPKTLVKGTTRN